MRPLPIHSVAAVAVLGFVLSSCGGSSPTEPPPPVPTTTLAPQPSPTPAPSPSPTAGAQTCNLQPGPVARLAISPRTQRTEGTQIDIKVRVKPEYSGEVWCLDQSKNHVLDFNASQKNAAGKECCYVGDVEWTVDDPSFIVNSRSVRHEDGFIYRINVEPKGRSTTVGVSAVLDGVRSHAWQSGSFYPQGPLQIVTMPNSQINAECTCTYHGNGVYTGNNCPKPKV